MVRGIRVKRYAQAIFKIALERGELEKWQSDLAQISQLISDKILVAVLNSPKFPLKEKTEILSKIAVKINPLALNLAYLLMDKGRLEVITDITEEYQKLIDSHHGIERAEVTTAISLDEEARAKLTKHLEAILGKKVTLRSEVDSKVIGGFVARIGGKLIDGSTRNKLELLKRELIQTR